MPKVEAQAGSGCPNIEYWGYLRSCSGTGPFRRWLKRGAKPLDVSRTFLKVTPWTRRPGTPMMKNWGLYVTCAGHHTIQPGDIFPSPKHPDEYFFSWKQGRILHEWQLILIEAGEGPVEFKDRAFTAAVGSLIVLPPGC